MKYSLTIGGLIAVIAVPVLANIGFSEACSNEVVQIGLTLPGVIMAYIGRLKQGDISPLGFKKN